MTRRFIGICFFAVAVSIQSTSAEELEPSSRAKIEQRIANLMKNHGIPGLSVAAAMGNQLCYSKGLGWADIENAAPATRETRYRTASIAKAMTAVVVMSLVEDGTIDLDAEVQQYCPDYPKKRWRVTTRQLLGHLAKQVGCKGVLVKTGLGESSLGEYRHTWADVNPHFIAEDVLHAVKWILADTG